MRRGDRKIKVFLSLALIICIPLAFTFFQYYSLSVADFLSSELKLETRDQISLSTVADDKLRVLGLTGSYPLFFLDYKVFEQDSATPARTPAPGLITVIIRC